MILVVLDTNIFISGFLFNGNQRKIIEYAVESHADFIITGDDGLLSLGSYMGIKIINSDSFLEYINITN